MNFKNIKHLLFLLSIYCIIVTSILYGDMSFVLLITGFIFIALFYKRTFRDVYLISFLANVVFGCIIIGVFQERGSFFDIGGDDSKYYRLFVETSKGFDFFLESRYGHYIYLGSTYIKVLEKLGFGTITPLLVYPLNWFIGANVCVTAYLLGQRFGLTENRAKIVSILLSIYPFFVFHEVKILRDIFAALLLALFILIYTSKWKLLLKGFGMLVIAAVCAKVRGELVLYMLLFWTVDWFFKLFYSKRRYKAFVLASLGLIIVAFGYNTFIGLTGREADDLDNLSSAYQELRSSSDAGSLGARLKNAGPLFSPVIVLYMLLSPFPPPILQQQNFYTFIISIGVFFWYIAYLKMPFFITNFYKRKVPIEKKAVVSKLSIYILVCSIMISLISADSRHLIPFYPLLFILYEILRQEYPTNKIKYLKSIVTFGITTIMGVYIILKFF